MSNLGPQKQNSSYAGILQIPGGITSSLQTVTDGLGNATGLSISTTAISGIGIVSSTAQNLYGGVAGAIVYQSAAGATSFVVPGTTGQLLSTNGGLAPTFVTVDANYVDAVATSGDSMTGALNMTGNLITNLATPVASTDAATKAYVDSIATGLQVKTAATCATTTNLASLSGLLTIDGVTVTAGQRVLVKNQTASQNNGIYVAAAGAWSRSTDADSWAELVSAAVFVTSGSVNGSTTWVCNVAPNGTLGTTSVTFVQFGASSSYTAGTGLTLAGNQFSITAPVTPALGGTGVTSLTGIPYGNNTSAFTVATGSQIASQIGSNAVAKATNIAGGGANRIPYQSATDTTGFLPAGTSGQILTSGGSGAVPFWQDGNQITVAPTNNGSPISGTSYRSIGDMFGDYLSVKDFGAAGDGSTDDQLAIQAAINSGLPIYFPSGTYICSDKITYSNGIGFNIKGDGSATTEIRFTSSNAANAGFEYTYPATVTSTVHITALTISTATGYVQNKNALTLNASAQISGGILQDRLTPRLFINDLICSGISSSSTSGWDTGIKLISVGWFRIENYAYIGDFSQGSSTGNWAGHGVWIGGAGIPVEGKITHTNIYSAEHAVFMPDYFEGLYISFCDWVNVQYGVYANYVAGYSIIAQASCGLLQLTYANNHCNFRRIGIVAYNANQHSITSSNLYASPKLADTGFAGIALVNGANNYIANNSIQNVENSVTTTSAWGIINTNIARSFICNNGIYYFNGSGVYLNDSSSDDNMVSNNIVFGTTTGIIASATAQNNYFSNNKGMVLSGQLYGNIASQDVYIQPYAISTVVSGGTGTQTWNLPVTIPSGVFFQKPSSGSANCSSVSNINCVYDYDASTATSIVIKMQTIDGSNIAPGLYRFSLILFA